MLDIDKILNNLSISRKILSSEADFQFALAWEIQKEYPDVEIRMEYCPYEIDKNMHIDILVIKDGLWIPIELKYKTKGGEIEVSDEKYYLKNHGAQDLGRYDFLKDVARIEHLKSNAIKFKEGYAIFLTNDNSYLSKASNEAMYKNFSLENGIIKNGLLSWNERTSKGTIKGREKSINIIDFYRFNWKVFSEIKDSNMTFKYLCVRINNESF
ncbi:MAG: hypothetical protein PHX40_03330 [Bacilli bacterium]|nr:hypothetical protein [Bacilli bacterium]